MPARQDRHRARREADRWASLASPTTFPHTRPWFLPCGARVTSRRGFSPIERDVRAIRFRQDIGTDPRPTASATCTGLVGPGGPCGESSTAHDSLMLMVNL